MIRRLALAFTLLAGSLALAPAAQACPMCKLANEDGSNPQAAALAKARPRAYQYSILFMLSMPFALTTAFGLTFYRMHRRQQAALAVAETESDGTPALSLEPTPA